jgi:hypothetical protein
VSHGFGLKRRESASLQRAGPAPIPFGTEELHPLHLVVQLVLVMGPRERGGVVGEFTLADDVAHPVQKSVTRHSSQN